jgi:hypothetical protein
LEKKAEEFSYLLFTVISTNGFYPIVLKKMKREWNSPSKKRRKSDAHSLGRVLRDEFAIWEK